MEKIDWKVDYFGKIKQVVGIKTVDGIIKKQACNVRKL